MTALLTSEVGNYAQISKYINEARRMGIEVSRPDINLSNIGFRIHDGKILFGLTAIRGVGETVVQEIMAGRPYTDFNDFNTRLHPDKTVNVSLIQGGCFGLNRDELLRSYADSLFESREYRSVVGLPTKKVMIDLNLITTDAEFKDKDTCRVIWNDHKRQLHEVAETQRRTKHMTEFLDKYASSPLMYDFETLSMFISDHPFHGLPEQHLKPFDSIDDGKKFVIGGTISRVERKKQKNGMTMAYIDILTIDPDRPLVEGVCFGNQFATYSELIKRGTNVCILAKKSGEQFVCEEIQTLDEWLVYLQSLEADSSKTA